jgi:uncharacterized protein YjbI with pentapeptide repeats
MVGAAPRHERQLLFYLADADLNSLHLENLGGAVLRNASLEGSLLLRPIFAGLA